MAAGLALIGEFHHSVPQVMFVGLLSGLGLAMCLAVGPVLMIESVSTEEQAVAGGSQNLLQGVAIAIITQVVFVLLSQHDHVVQGTALYSDASYRKALWVSAALALAGAVLTSLIPKASRIGDAGVEVGDADGAVGLTI
jgi:MFS family permease